MKLDQAESAVRLHMAALGESLHSRGYAVGGAGNMSALLPDGNVLVTPTNSCLGRLNPERLSKIDLAGSLISGDPPSKEYPFHLVFYRDNPGCGAVVHLHCTYLTALSCLEGLDREDVITPFTPYYVMRVGRLALVPYFRPGSPHIARELNARKNSAGAFLLANHGAVVTGRNIVDAVNNMEELEETAKLHFILSGSKIRHLTRAEVDELRPS